MSTICECGQATSLPAIGASACGIDFGEIQLAAFVDLRDQPMVSSDSLGLKTVAADKSNWTGLLTGSGEKVTLSPELFNVSTTPGDAVTWTGNNGSEQRVSVNPTTISAELRRTNLTAPDQLDKLSCLAEQGNLGLYLFDGTGRVIGQKHTITTAGDAIKPIKCISVFIQDRSWNGRQEPDHYPVTFQFDGGYSRTLDYVILNKVGGSTEDWRGTDLLT